MLLAVINKTLIDRVVNQFMGIHADQNTEMVEHYDVIKFAEICEILIEVVVLCFQVDEYLYRVILLVHCLGYDNERLLLVVESDSPLNRNLHFQ